MAKTKTARATSSPLELVAAAGQHNAARIAEVADAAQLNVQRLKDHISKVDIGSLERDVDLRGHQETHCKLLANHSRELTALNRKISASNEQDFIKLALRVDAISAEVTKRLDGHDFFRNGVGPRLRELEEAICPRVAARLEALEKAIAPKRVKWKKGEEVFAGKRDGDGRWECNERDEWYWVPDGPAERQATRNESSFDKAVVSEVLSNRRGDAAHMVQRRVSVVRALLAHEKEHGTKITDKLKLAEIIVERLSGPLEG